MKHVDLRIEQAVGVGKGYFIEESPPGINLLIELRNEGDRLLQLVVTRFNASTLTFDVQPHSDFAVGIASVQTVGIFVPDGGKGTGKGRLTIIPNFAQINLS